MVFAAANYRIRHSTAQLDDSVDLMFAGGVRYSSVDLRVRRQPYSSGTATNLHCGSHIGVSVWLLRNRPPLPPTDAESPVSSSSSLKLSKLPTATLIVRQR
jgi:hypothetical protein